MMRTVDLLTFMNVMAAFVYVGLGAHYLWMHRANLLAWQVVWPMCLSLAVVFYLGIVYLFLSFGWMSTLEARALWLRPAVLLLITLQIVELLIRE